VILLDTPSLIWWASHNAELSATALGHIESQRPGGKILISAISAWEVAHWAAAGQLGLRMEPGAWWALIAAVPEIHLVPMNHEIALETAALPEPAPERLATRILVATARHHGCPIITRSEPLRAYKHIKTLW
jgi:PIN domain nuclease of toxin-antitoxin system